MPKHDIDGTVGVPVTRQTAAHFLVRHGPSSQQGVLALFAAVVILVAATLIVLYSASPVRTEQQVTANERRSFQALNAAEAGLAYALAAITQYDHDKFIVDDTDYPALCGTQKLGANGKDGEFAVTHVNGMTCTNGWPPFGKDEVVLGYRSVPVVVEGRSDDGVALRVLGQTYFLIDPRDPNPGGGNLSPLNFQGTLAEFDTANSEKFEVDGGGGTAVATSTTANQNFVIGAIEQTGNMANYKGGISGGGFGEPFDDPNSLSTFVKAIDAGSPTLTGPVNQGNHTWDNDVYWVSGDMEIGGNQSGSGVLVVEGKLTTHGTPDWTGLIIVLGGEYEVKGGGKGDYYGSIFVANLDLNNPTEFGDTEFHVAGGGNLQFYASDKALKDACALLPDEAKWLPGVDNEGNKGRWDCDSIDLAGGGGSEPFEPLTGILSGSWIDYQQN